MTMPPAPIRAATVPAALHRALDRGVVASGPTPFANQDLIELRAAIELLGDVLSAEERATMRQVEEQAEAAQAALFGTLLRKPAAARPPKRGRNQTCWCGSGRKYKLCHRRADEDALLAG
jgi:hypothetical protein